MVEYEKVVRMSNCSDPRACQSAAMRAYSELCRSGVWDRDAFNAAVRVFRHHHPETPSHEARYVVADWLATEADEVDR